MRERAMDETLKRAESKLHEYAKDSRISCTLARKIAEELDIHYEEVGKAANRLKIKIHNCELGCF